jgi:hypothetical protein
MLKSVRSPSHAKGTLDLKVKKILVNDVQHFGKRP